MRSCLTNRQQRVRVNSNNTTRENIISRVSQGSILEPLLFNIFINDQFLSCLSNYANSNTLNDFGYNLEFYAGRYKEYITFLFWLTFKMVWRKFYGLNANTLCDNYDYLW